MQCQSCHSTSQAELSAEIAIHFPGRENLNTPHVYVFPDITVCLDCGSTSFKVPDAKLQSIRERVPQSSRARADCPLPAVEIQQEECGAGRPDRGPSVGRQKW